MCSSDLIQALNGQGLLLAYHDRADGGLFATLCEMAFAARCGLAIELPRDNATAELFNEELGCVLQVRASDYARVRAEFEAAGLGDFVFEIGRPVAGEEILFMQRGAEVLRASRIELHRAWSATTYQMQKLRDHPECAQQEYDRILDAGDPGISPHVSFNPQDDVAAPFIGGTRPRMAILREQGVNGQIEMAAAFEIGRAHV